MYAARSDVRGVHSGSRHPLVELKHLRGHEAVSIQETIKEDSADIVSFE